MHAAMGMLKFLGLTSLGGHMANVLAALVLQGWDEAKDKMVPDSIGEAATATAAGMFTGVFGALGVPVVTGLQAVFSSGDTRGEHAVRLLSSASTITSLLFELGSFAASQADATANTEYRGHTPLGKVAVLVERLAPIVRDIDRGLGGFAALAITSDPDIRAARNKMFAWKEANDIDTVRFGGEPSEFGTFMRSFKLEMKGRGGINDINAAEIARRIEANLPDGKDVNSAIASLRKDLQLEWLDDVPAAKSQEFRDAMGPKRMATLRGYDAIVRSIISHLEPPKKLRGR